MRKRVTRGYSDLHKEEQNQPIESEQSSSEQESNNPPKQKKIHHMTLKAMERRQKMLQSGELKSQSKSENVQKIPKKRGRPKGFKVKRFQEKEDYELQEMIKELSEISQKKEIVLRKRDPSKKMLDEDSQLLEKEFQEIQQEPVQLKIVEIKKPAEIVQPQISSQLSQDAPVPHVPKKRGRKKKIIVQSAPLPSSTVPPLPAQKLFTIPKAQTYDNYIKYYDSIMQKQEENENDISLIFNKFMDPEGYNILIKSIK